MPLAAPAGDARGRSEAQQVIRCENRGKVENVRFSLNHRFVAVKRSDVELELLDLLLGNAFTHLCKGRLEAAVADPQLPVDGDAGRRLPRGDDRRHRALPRPARQEGVEARQARRARRRVVRLLAPDAARDARDRRARQHHARPPGPAAGHRPHPQVRSAARAAARRVRRVGRRRARPAEGFALAAAVTAPRRPAVQRDLLRARRARAAPAAALPALQGLCRAQVRRATLRAQFFGAILSAQFSAQFCAQFSAQFAHARNSPPGTRSTSTRRASPCRCRTTCSSSTRSRRRWC